MSNTETNGADNMNTITCNLTSKYHRCYNATYMSLRPVEGSSPDGSIMRPLVGPSSKVLQADFPTIWEGIGHLVCGRICTIEVPADEARRFWDRNVKIPHG